jgi:hypothetical protein
MLQAFRRLGKLPYPSLLAIGTPASDRLRLLMRRS